MYAHSNVKNINIRYNRHHEQHIMKKSRAHTHNGDALCSTSNFNEKVQTVTVK